MARRRANGEGSLRQRSDGLWECTIMDGFQPDGRRRYKSFYGKTQTEVRKKRNEYIRLRDAGMIVSKEYTFGEWADMWYENHNCVFCKAGASLPDLWHLCRSEPQDRCG